MQTKICWKNFIYLLGGVKALPYAVSNRTVFAPPS